MRRYAAMIGVPLLLLAVAFFLFTGTWMRQGTGVQKYSEYEYDSIPKIHILIQPSDWKKIEEKRLEALQTGIHTGDGGEFVAAQIIAGGKLMTAEVRLKGDWVDHMIGSKWSFRIELKGGETWQRKINFSVQSPDTRNYLAEWFFHQLLEEADVLTTTFDFVVVTINHSNRGIYAWEEHFEKQLVESRNRREGPVIKFSEEGLWQMRQIEAKTGKRLNTGRDAVESAEIRPFDEAAVFADTNRMKQFQVAASLLQQYAYSNATAAEVFDIHLLARFLVMTELMRAYHGLYWHNLRFYYNPVTSLLEPISFDGDCDGDWKGWMKKGILPRGYFFGATPFRDIFKDEPGFEALYFRYLDEYTSDVFLDRFFAKRKNAFEKRQEWISREFIGYRFDLEGFREHARTIREKFVDPQRAQPGSG